jgi:hypothetical protein
MPAPTDLKAFWDQPKVRESLRSGDITGAYRALHFANVSQRAIGRLTGQSLAEVSHVLHTPWAIRNVDAMRHVVAALELPAELFGLVADYQPALERALSERSIEDGPERADDPHFCIGHAGSCGMAVHEEGPLVLKWTGVEVGYLRNALRMPVRVFGRHLGATDRTISKWAPI